MNFNKPPTKELIRDIGSMRTTALTLIGLAKSYELLLKALLSTDYYNVENTPWPNMKILMEETGWSNGKIRKELNNIYEDLKLGAYDGIKFEIKKVEYYYYIIAYRRSLTIQVSDLKVIPQVGNSIYFPYFESYIGNYFHVTRIDHKFSDTTQEITFWLSPGEYNQYAAYEKDKAYLKGEIDFYEYYGYSSDKD